MSSWDTGVLAMDNDDEYLHAVRHYNIEQLQSLEDKVAKDLEWRLKCIKCIIEDKKADTGYIPEQYQ